ncbi:hypothetical protein CARUB_v10003910mg [Capsella rubella]|uniref:RING-type E3 ubiquitin transferase n=1 Tax=Capsella rubella TaxID=81985 RepID=R0FD29_9BRAS|nr:probable E3 ubiquitin-protein ligase RHY1A [Capsella rubella]EOA19751.1 hypothetical protein CARUB_v10003910mg [Capsella rubella]
MNTTKVELHIKSSNKLSTSPELNSVLVVVQTRLEEISVNQTTGQYQTLRSTRFTTSFVDTINLHSSSVHDIRSLLDNRRSANYHGLSDRLAPEISAAAINLGFGRNGFTLTLEVKVTYQTVSYTSNEEKYLRMVLLGRIKSDELKSSNMETESCSICLENLSGPMKPSDFMTRMTCSHVFHYRCLLEWLKRKNTCPLCRTVLYDP